MRARLLLLALAIAVLAVPWSRETGRALAPPPADPKDPVLPSPPRTMGEPTPWPASGRDPFRFPGSEPRAEEPRQAVAAPADRATPPPPAHPVRLFGLVRRPSGLKAALAMDGEVVLAAVGDNIGGFLVLSIDEEGFVRLRDRDGLEVTLNLPEEP